MSEQTGVSYPSDGAGPIGEWSARIYEALASWRLAQQNEWTRWEPGYLLLTIRKVDGAEVDPIQVYTADEELTVSFGFWETNTPAPYELWETDPEVIAQHAKELVERWLSGDVRTAVLTDQGGKWCGSIIIEPANSFLSFGKRRNGSATSSPLGSKCGRRTKTNGRASRFRITGASHPTSAALFVESQP